MKTTYPIAALAAAIGLGNVGLSVAAGDLTAQPPVEVKVNLGTKDGTLRFVPENLEFETGKLYRLVLHNPSPMAHYFSSVGLARAVFTRKAQVLGPDGKPIAEVKGNVTELEVHPGGTAEWWFVPVKTANLNDLKCTIKDHAESGMIGTIAIK